MIRKLSVAAIVGSLVLSGCSSSSSQFGAVENERGQSRVVEPMQAGPSGTTTTSAPVDADPEPGVYRIDPTTGRADPIVTGARAPRDAERSPDGSRLVYVASEPGGTPQIFVLKDGRSKKVTHLRGGALEPTWSPDGTRIAFAGAMTKGRDSDIFVVEADGGLVRLAARTNEYDRRPDWSPDGSRIVFDTYGEIWLVTVNDGTLTRLALTPRRAKKYPSDRHGWAADPTWSRDGRWIAFTRFDPSTINGIAHIVRLWIVRSDGTDERPLRRQWKRFWFWQLEPSWSPDGRSIAFVGTRTNDRGFTSPATPSDIGILDVRTGKVAYLSTALRVWDLSWDAKGLIASVGDHTLPSPPFTGVTDRRSQDPWPASSR